MDNGSSKNVDDDYERRPELNICGRMKDIYELFIVMNDYALIQFSLSAPGRRASLQIR